MDLIGECVYVSGVHINHPPKPGFWPLFLACDIEEDALKGDLGFLGLPTCDLSFDFNKLVEWF